MTTSTPSLAQVLMVLRTDYPAVTDDLLHGNRAFWIGSGISKGKVDDLNDVLRKVLTYLRDTAISPHDENADACRTALLEILNEYLKDEVVPATANLAAWKVPTNLSSLVNQYASVMDTHVPNCAPDFLLWDAVDVRTTFANPSIEPGVAHYLIALLLSEGLVEDLVSANWDGLLEKALTNLSCGRSAVRVGMSNESIRGVFDPPHLFKIHGCAVKARDEPAKYREFLVASKSQIHKWKTDERYETLRRRVASLVADRRTIFLGLSVQDGNLLDLFQGVAASAEWPWDSDNPPLLFAEPDVGANQTTALRVSYGHAYTANTDEVRERSVVGWYAAPLLAALLVDAMKGKLALLIRRSATEFNLSPATIAAAEVGIESFEAALVSGVGSDFNALVHSFRSGLSELMRRHYGPDVCGVDGYVPVSAFGQSTLENSDRPLLDRTSRLALVLGLIGVAASDLGLPIELETSEADTQGTLVLGKMSSSGADATRIVVVRDEEAADAVVRSSFWNETGAGTTMIRLSAPTRSFRRGASMALGEERDPGNQRREVWISNFGLGSDDMVSIQRALCQEVGI